MTARNRPEDGSTLDTATKRRIDKLATIDELVDRLKPILPERLHCIADSVDAQPRAARADLPRASGYTTVKFCEHHQSDCCGPDGKGLCGEGTTYPAVSDPTGEAAVRAAMHGDPAQQNLKALDRHLDRILRELDGIAGIVARYQPRHANEHDRHKAGPAEPGCGSCSRIEISKGITRWEPIYRTTHVGERALPLCRWCWDWLGDTGRLPNPRELTDHHAGKKLRKPQPHATVGS